MESERFITFLQGIGESAILVIVVLAVIFLMNWDMIVNPIDANDDWLEGIVEDDEDEEDKENE